MGRFHMAGPLVTGSPIVIESATGEVIARWPSGRLVPPSGSLIQFDGSYYEVTNVEWSVDPTLARVRVARVEADRVRLVVGTP